MSSGVYYSPASYNPASVTYVTSPKVSEIQINELLPFQVTPTYSIDQWVVRSNVKHRGALANHMLLAWRPEDLDYGSEYDSTSMPQVYLFPSEREQIETQKQLYRDHPSLNLQSYRLQVPVRIATNTYPGAGVTDTGLLFPGLSAPVYPLGPTELAYGNGITYTRPRPSSTGTGSRRKSSRKSSRRTSTRRASK